MVLQQLFLARGGWEGALSRRNVWIVLPRASSSSSPVQQRSIHKQQCIFLPYRTSCVVTCGWIETLGSSAHASSMPMYMLWAALEQAAYHGKQHRAHLA